MVSINLQLNTEIEVLIATVANYSTYVLLQCTHSISFPSFMKGEKGREQR